MAFMQAPLVYHYYIQLSPMHIHIYIDISTSIAFNETCSPFSHSHMLWSSFVEVSLIAVTALMWTAVLQQCMNRIFA